MNTELNYVATGGNFGSKRRLATFTFHQHENGTFYVTDDRQAGKWVSGGWPTLDRAEAAHTKQNEQRVAMW